MLLGIYAIGTGDLAAFGTTADPQLGLLPNVLGLYGFWAEQTGRFASMKDFVPPWPLVLAVLLSIGIAGVVGAWRNSTLDSLRPWATGLVAAGILAVVLDLGVADPHTAWLVHWLNSVFPPYRGMRDSGKWAALIALVYSQLIAFGALSLLGWIRDHAKLGGVRDFVLAGLTALK